MTVVKLIKLMYEEFLMQDINGVAEIVMLTQSEFHSPINEENNSLNS